MASAVAYHPLRVTRTRHQIAMISLADRAISYLARLPAAVSGQGGHTATFHAALVLVKGFALSVEKAFPILKQWNESHCQPPWSDADLRHKLLSAARSDRAPGYLLASPPPPCLPPRLGPNPSALRQRWPVFSPVTAAQVETIANLRCLPVAAVELCARARFLFSANYDGQMCFLISEKDFAQARRFDGQPLRNHECKPIKGKNLPGSRGAFIGQQLLGSTPPVLLVEGAIGLLEAVAALHLAGRLDWTVLAATSASSRFARDPALLARVKGRRVRIIPDADKAGMDAAASWLADLEKVGAAADVLALPDGFKDLGEMVTTPAAHNLLPSLFSL